MSEKNLKKIDKLAISITEWIGSSASIIIHTALFAVAFISPILGFNFETMLLALTTAVSLEAIYLAIFIQMTVNRNTQSLEEVEEDIDEIQDDIDEIIEDVDEIMEDEKNEDIRDKATQESLMKIQNRLESLLQDIERLKGGK